MLLFESISRVVALRLGACMRLHEAVFELVTPSASISEGQNSCSQRLRNLWKQIASLASPEARCIRDA